MKKWRLITVFDECLLQYDDLESVIVGGWRGIDPEGDLVVVESYHVTSTYYLPTYFVDFLEPTTDELVLFDLEVGIEYPIQELLTTFKRKINK